MILRDNYKILSLLLIILSILSFFLGFYFDENAAGAGGYDGDYKNSWQSIQAFSNYDILAALDKSDHLSNRPPLIWILHAELNPFATTEMGYRRSVFAISLLTPILFYLCLKQKFQNENSLILILIASTVFLSPYYRTSAYWGLEENYGFITLLTTFLFLNYFLTNKNNNNLKTHFYLFLLTFFSSLCIYFDQKLLIIPIICFLTIVLSKTFINLKILSIIYYLLFSIPFIYLIYLWGGIFPTELTRVRNIGSEFYPGHIGYASAIIAFYFLPFLLFKKENILKLLQNFFSNKGNFFLLVLFFLYLIYLIVFYDFFKQSPSSGHLHLGKGILHKFSLVLFGDHFFRQIFVYFAFFISWLVILVFAEKDLKNISIIAYFLIISSITMPMLQEYFDPLIYLMVFTFFNSKLFFNYKRSIGLYLYLFVFFAGTNIYYLQILN